jgi:hypothetical protein
MKHLLHYVILLMMLSTHLYVKLELENEIVLVVVGLPSFTNTASGAALEIYLVLFSVESNQRDIHINF